MFISQTGIDLIKSFEGCVLHAYKDATGTLTIGYGHTSGVKDGQVITQSRAEEMLKNDLMHYANSVQKLIDNKTILFNVNQNMFDSLTSFCYNCGAGNLLKLVKSRSVSEVSQAIMLYCKSKGVILKGLVRRRTAERDLFLKPMLSQPTKTVRLYSVKKGDNLTKIAKELKTTVSKLADMNDIHNINLIHIGQVLKY